MKLGDWFLAAVVLLEVCAVLAYLLRRDYREACVWFGAALSNAAYLSLVRL